MDDVSSAAVSCHPDGNSCQEICWGLDGASGPGNPRHEMETRGATSCQ